jgi:hypothetical protein
MRKTSLTLALLVSGCGAGPPPDVPAGCNPLVGDDCLTPFPSGLYEVADGTSATGVRVALPADRLPVSSQGVAIRPDRLDQKDGFSPASPFLVYFKAGVDATQLPTADTLAASVTAQSAVQVIEAATGARVPVMAELDLNAMADFGDRQALFIRPMVRLKNSTRYVIALVGLNDASGKPLAPPGFVALRDRTPLNAGLKPLVSRYEDLFGVLTTAGVARKSVTLAWDVTTASDETATGNLVAMRDHALLQVPNATWSLTDSNITGDAHLLRELTGTFDVESYLTDDTTKATMLLSDGKPAVRGIGKAKIVVHIPQCAATATAPLPVLVFGHGLFGNAQTELSSDYEKQVGDTLCMVQIGTDWIGLSSADVATLSTVVLNDLNQIEIITDQLQQAHLNAQVMTRLFLTRIKDDPLLQVNGKPVTDGKEVYYYGISDGGIQGGTFLALSEDVIRGVLNVPGCEWSLMMFRSHDFASLKPLLSGIYPDPLDQQLAIALSQSEWDHSDPASFAPHLLADPLPGVMPKRVLVQEAIGDSQVPNLATRVLVRTIGLPGNDLEQQVYGVDEKPAPLDSAYTQWDVHPMPLPPPGDVPPTGENPAHEAIRRLDLLVAQLGQFLKPDGQVQQTCPGVCSF